MNRIAFPSLLLALTISASACADVVAFVGMPLTASQEVPVVASNGYGSVTALYDPASWMLTYHVACKLSGGVATS